MHSLYFYGKIIYITNKSKMDSKSFIEKVLDFASQKHYSDVHISSNNKVRIRNLN
ncbi:MAG: hypothetical protein LBC61_07200 [Candidatus Peribacteria bacterium]|nr:hypothetical protein [Candidatus Peribacteria bacterium]